jgi:hypothetical protein
MPNKSLMTSLIAVWSSRGDIEAHQTLMRHQTLMCHQTVSLRSCDITSCREYTLLETREAVL